VAQDSRAQELRRDVGPVDLRKALAVWQPREVRVWVPGAAARRLDQPQAGEVAEMQDPALGRVRLS
jgi:hypothetical protein